MTLGTALALAASVHAACVHAQTSVAAMPLPSSGEIVCEGAATGACRYRDPASGLLFAWPNDWPIRRLKLVTATGPPARARQLDANRWISLQYLPDDPAQPEVSVFQVAVLRREDWLVQSAQRVPVNCTEVATGRHDVAVASIAAVNPYPAGSRDAEIFDALTPTLAEISLIVRFTEQR